MEGPVAPKWDMPHGSLKGFDSQYHPQEWLGVGCRASFRALGLSLRWPLCLCSCLSLPTAPQMLPQHRALPLDSSPNQFSLYTSPSLPNISLGLQATVTVTNSHLAVSMGTYPLLSLVLSTLVLYPHLGLLSSQGSREIR